MYRYHDTEDNKRRLEAHIDHCQSDHRGQVWELGSLVEEGRIRDPENRENMLTTPELGVRDPGVWIYAINLRREIRIARDTIRGSDGAIKHETLFHNEDVLGAGEVQFENGVVAKMNGASGTYKCYSEFETFADLICEILDSMKIAHRVAPGSQCT